MQWFKSLSNIQKLLIGIAVLFVSGLIYNWVALLGFALLIAGGYAIYQGIGDFLKVRWMKITAAVIVLVLPFGLGAATGEAILNPSSSEVTQQAQESDPAAESEAEQEEPATATPSPEASSDGSAGTNEPEEAATGESSEPVESGNQTEESSGEVSTNQPSFEELIGQLKVATEVSSGYDRDLFKHWVDADRDGCDTRREVLIEESLTPVTVGSGCSISGGSWFSAYDSRNTTDASTFDIDHMVPLKEAWDSGAHAWDSKTRESFANDLGFAQSLIAVSASSNRSKSDRDPADWLPTNREYVCEYIYSWVQVKIRWSLTADSREVSALRSNSEDCSVESLNFRGQPGPAAVVSTPKPTATATPSPSPTRTATPSPSPTQTSTPTPTPTGDLDPRFSSCKAAKEAGYGPYVKGVDPEYAWYRDGDGDGTVCE
jgi:hypothetical protein